MIELVKNEKNVDNKGKGEKDQVQELKSEQKPNEAKSSQKDKKSNAKNELQSSTGKKPSPFVYIPHSNADFFLFLLNSILYLIVIFLQFNMYDIYTMSSSLKSFFSPEDLAFLPNSHHFLSKYLSPKAFHTHLATLANIPTTEKIINSRFKISSTFRITLRRIKLLQNVASLSPLINKGSNEVLAKNKIKINSKFSSKTEESSEKNGYSFDKKSSYLGKGGYVLEFDPAKGDFNEKVYASFIGSGDDDDSEGERQNSLIVVDFVTINQELKYLASVVLEYQYSKFAEGEFDIKLYFVNKNNYGKSLGIFEGVVEGLYVISLILYLVFLINDIMGKVRGSTLFIGDWMLIIQCLSFILCIVGIALWLAIIIIKNTKMSSIRAAFQSFEGESYHFSLSDRNELIKLGQILNSYKKINGINLLLMFLRLVKLFSQYFTPMQIILNTVFSSLSTLFAFFLFYLVGVLGFSFFAWLYYGTTLSSFSSLSKSFNMNFSLGFKLLNKPKLIAEMYDISAAITFLYVTIMVVTVSIIIANLCIIVLMYYYKDEYAKAKIEKSNFVINAILFYATCCKRNKIINIKKNCSAKNANYLTTKSKLNFILDVDPKTDEKLLMLSLTKVKLDDEGETNFNEDYDENYEVNSRDKYYESIKDVYNVQKYYRTKVVQIIFDVFVYIFFFICFVVFTYYLLMTPWGKNFDEAIQSKLLINEFKAKSLDDIKTFFFQSLPQGFSTYTDQGKTFANIQNNVLQGNQIMLSLSYGEKEHEEIILSDGSIVVYTDYPSYNHKYAYFYKFDPTKTVSEEDRSKLIKENLSRVVAEFVLHNKEYHSYIYFYVSLKVINGGEFEKNAESSFIKYDEIQPTDTIKFVFLGLGVVIYIFIIFRFLYYNYIEWQKYTMWYKKKILHMSTKMKHLREKEKSEFLRRIEAIMLTYNNIVDVLIIVITLFVFILFILVEVDNKFLMRNIEKNVYKLRDSFYITKTLKEFYIAFSLCDLVLISIRIISLVQSLGKSFTKFRLLLTSYADIASLVLIIILAHPSFILFSYISLGDHTKDYYTFNTVVVSVLRGMFGYIDIDTLVNYDSVFGGILFYIYVIVVNMVLINFFFCVVYNSIVISSQETKNQIDFDFFGALAGSDENEAENVDQKSGDIFAEFDYDTVKSSMRGKSFLSSGDMKEVYPKIKSDDLLIAELIRKKHLIDVVYESTYADQIDDNPYKGISASQYNAFGVYLVESLTKLDEMMVEEMKKAKEMEGELKDNAKEVNYEELTKQLVEKKEKIRAKINQIDTDYLRVKDQLDKIYQFKRLEKSLHQQESSQRKEAENSSQRGSENREGKISFKESKNENNNLVVHSDSSVSEMSDDEDL